MTAWKILKTILTVGTIVWANLCTPDSLYDLNTLCAERHDLAEFVIDIKLTDGSPRFSQIAQFFVQRPENHRGKAGNAYRKLQIVKQFFIQEAGWSSVDGRNAPIFLLGNLTTNVDSEQCIGRGAYFAPRDGINIIFILLGHISAREDLANDIDIIGHEFGHGIFDATHPSANNRTLELGSMNEGIADMLGVTVRAWHESGQRLDQTVVRGDSFLLGRTFARISSRYYEIEYEGGALRNNLDPSADGRTYDHYDEIDDEGVHVNSGIISLPYALLVKGGSHPRIPGGPEVQGLGFEKAFKILFYTMEHRFPYNTMPEFAAAMQRAASRLYGQNSLEWRSTTNAFATTGLIDSVGEGPSEPQPTPAPEPLPLPTPEPQPEPAPVPQPQPAPEPQPEPAPVPQPQPAPEPQTETEPANLPEPESEDPGAGEEGGELPSLHARTGIYVSGPTALVILGIALSALMVLAALLTQRRRVEIDRMILQQPATAGAVVRQPVRVKPPKPAVFSPDPTVKLKNDSLAVTFVVNQGSYSAKLDENPLVIGRDPALDLPDALRKVLELDGKISRQHMEMWYQSSSRMVYIRCTSRNGMTVSGQLLRLDEKVKVDIHHRLDLILGDTHIKLVFQE